VWEYAANPEEETIMTTLFVVFVLGAFFGLMAEILEKISNRKMLARFSKVIFYGPHGCDRCGRMIAKASLEQGGRAYNYPSGNIYPNTEWEPHVCYRTGMSDDFDISV
jgi:hypothetical protein